MSHFVLEPVGSVTSIFTTIDEPDSAGAMDVMVSEVAWRPMAAATAAIRPILNSDIDPWVPGLPGLVESNWVDLDLETWTRSGDE